MTRTEFYALLTRIDPKMYAGLSCEDGSIISIQASTNHYCSPKEDSLPTYTHYEVFSKEPLDSLEKYKIIDRIYGYVPVDDLITELESRGKITAKKWPSNYLYQ